VENTIMSYEEVTGLRPIPVRISAGSVARIEEAPELARKEGGHIACAGGTIMNEPIMLNYKKSLVVGPEGAPKTKGLFVVNYENCTLTSVDITPEEEKGLMYNVRFSARKIEEVMAFDWHRLLFVYPAAAIAINKNLPLVLSPRVTYNSVTNFEGTHYCAIVLDADPTPGIRPHVALESASESAHLLRNWP
jgi:hypothetical protein